MIKIRAANVDLAQRPCLPNVTIVYYCHISTLQIHLKLLEKYNLKGMIVIILELFPISLPAP